MEDLRKSERVEAQHFISYDVLDEKNQILYSGLALSLDLSRKGVQLEDRIEFPVNSKVRLHLALADEIVDVEGKIRHIEPVEEEKFHIGIEFVEMEDELVTKIAKTYPNILT